MAFKDADRKIPAIPTVYRGVQYRSRLEARWAAFFDLVGWKYQYEPFDLEGWIPDFLILGKQPVLVEVKPVIRFPKEVADEIDAAGYEYEALILGCVLTPQPIESDTVHPLCFGWLREVDIYDEDTHASSNWGDACLGRWREGKGMIGFCHDPGSYSDRISGGYDGGSWGSLSLSPAEIESFWNRAGNLVQWRGKQSVSQS